jgi:hypothetical protein
MPAGCGEGPVTLGERDGEGMKKVLNKNKEYFLTQTVPCGEQRGKYWVVYPHEVYPFDYEGIELFIHRPYSNILEWDPLLWAVSEKKTGASVVMYLDSPKEVMECAIDKFKGKGVDYIAKCKAIIDSFTFENGFKAINESEGR